MPDSTRRSIPDSIEENNEDGEFFTDGGGGAEEDVQGHFGQSPEVGMLFSDHIQFISFYKSYARRLGFSVSVRRSSFTDDEEINGVNKRRCLYMELMCSKGGRRRQEPKYRHRSVTSTGCLARVRSKLWSDGFLHLELAVIDHNHLLSPSLASAVDSGPHQTPSVGPAFDPFSGLAEVLFSGNCSSRSSSNSSSNCLKLGEEDANCIRVFLTRMQASNSNFFHCVDLSSDGRVRNLFWADAQSRAAYEYFSDVVLLDSFCVSSNYDCSVAAFVGSNNHGQMVLLGCALLADESEETYSWLIKAWLACGYGKLPNAFISDQCRGLQIAVGEVMPAVRHRLCLFQIMRRVPEKLGGLGEYRAISKQMQKAVYDSLRPEEFEEEWRKMIDVHGLQGNEWLISLYHCRFMWVPVYLKDAFWAGLSTLARNEAVNPFFEGYLDSKASIKQFLGNYEMALRSRYEKEVQADFETFHKRRPAVSKFIMEEQLSKVYTLNIFKKFQDEIESIMYCHPSLVKMEGLISTFDVKECMFLDDGKKTMSKHYEVIFNDENKNVQCLCGSFQFRGILCRHALTVFKMQKVHEIPSQFILDRWKKDFKRLHFMGCDLSDVVAANRMERYDYLSKRCLLLAEVGVITDKYQLALKLIKEAQEFLLSDSTYEDTLPRIVTRVPKMNKLDNNNNQSGERNASAPFEKNLVKIPKQQGTRSEQKETQISVNTQKVENLGYAFQTAPTVQKLLPRLLHRDSANPQFLPFVGQGRLLSGHPHDVGDQAGSQPPGIFYMFPSGGDGQVLGNATTMPWIYQQRLQAGQPPTAALDLRRGNAPKRQKVRYALKPSESLQNTDVSPTSTASTAPG